MKPDCWRCKKPGGTAGVGLCKKCRSWFRWNAKKNPDVAYELWLRGSKRVSVPHDLAMPVIQAGLDMAGGVVNHLAERTGVDERTFGRIIKQKKPADLQTVLMVGEYIGLREEVDSMFCNVGVDCWSDLGQYCGDGAHPELDGCGTFHHEHYAGGLCEECYDREVLGVGPELPRDVRLAGMVAS